MDNNIERPNLIWYIGLILTLPLLILNWLHPIRTIIRYQRLVKFVLVSGVSVIVGLGTLWSLTDIAGLYYLGSNALAFIASTLTWYCGHRMWTFNDKRSRFGLSKSFPTRLLVLGLSTGWLALFTEIVGLWYMLSAVLAIMLSFPVSYVISTKYIWSKAK